MTRRLYHEDATLRRFDAEVVGHAEVGGKVAVVLDRTAFYPEAGGQLGDHGRLGDVTVIDTQELDDGRIAHVLAGEPPDRSVGRGRDRVGAPAAAHGAAHRSAPPVRHAARSCPGSDTVGSASRR